MIFYLTYNEQPSGIYSSQVIDVVKYIRTELKAEIKLVSFISIRKYFRNRSIIKNQLPDAIVLPMYPKVENWRKNNLLLEFICKLNRPNKIIGRSVLATQLALRMRENLLCKKVVYDGRGAIAAEWSEYKVIENSQLTADIKNLEKEVILNSDFRIAVSRQLVKYWQDVYTYNQIDHVVIPCTLNDFYRSGYISTEAIKQNRKSLDLNEDDVVFVYSGSMAGWQSLNLISDFVTKHLRSSKKTKFLFLSDLDSMILNLQHEFPGQVICMKVEPSQVPMYLMTADYGLLIREVSVTNQVASPVKFAEYLACGLKIIISESLGDYTEFVRSHNCGYTEYDFANKIELPVSLNEKQRIRKLGLESFAKSNFLKMYEKVIF